MCVRACAQPVDSKEVPAPRAGYAGTTLMLRLWRKNVRGVSYRPAGPWAGGGEIAGLADTERSGATVTIGHMDSHDRRYGWASDDPRWTDEPASSSQWNSNGNGRLDPGQPPQSGAEPDESWDQLLTGPPPRAITGPTEPTTAAHLAVRPGYGLLAPEVRGRRRPLGYGPTQPSRTAAAPGCAGATPASFHRRRVPPDEPRRDLRCGAPLWPAVRAHRRRGTHCRPSSSSVGLRLPAARARVRAVRRCSRACPGSRPRYCSPWRWRRCCGGRSWDGGP